MYCDWIYALKVVDFKLELLGQTVMAHFERLRSMCNHFANLKSLVICGWICCMLSVIIAKSSAYVIVVHVAEDVLKWYPISFSSHLRRGSKKMIDRYGLRVSTCIVHRLISIGNVVPK